jgi:hypothetical protein
MQSSAFGRFGWAGTRASHAKRLALHNGGVFVDAASSSR